MKIMAILTGLAVVLLLADAGEGQDRRRRHRKDDAPKKGEKAPDFTLKRLGDPDEEVTLSDFEGEAPVVLIFGSYT